LLLYAGHGSAAESAIVASVTSVVVAGWDAVANDIAAATHAASGGTATLTAAHGGTLNCAGLERLWESAGGSPGEAFTAAEIAMAESGGRQYATNTNGGRSTDRGYWQVNSVHGAQSTYDAYGNARAAVQISGDGRDWSPWVTWQTGAYQGQC
jgi:hypothetical protein